MLATLNIHFENQMQRTVECKLRINPGRRLPKLVEVEVRKIMAIWRKSDDHFSNS